MKKVKRFGTQQSSRKGASVVEAALMLPVLVLITFGSIDLAQYINSGQVVANASREASRVATRADSVSDIQSAMEDYLSSAIPNVDSEKVKELFKIEVQHVTFDTSTESGSTNTQASFSGNGNGNSGNGGNGKGKGKGNSNSDTPAPTGGTSEDFEKTDYSSGKKSAIPNGDLTSVPSGDTVSVSIVFDFTSIRWFSGVPFPSQDIETYGRRE